MMKNLYVLFLLFFSATSFSQYNFRTADSVLASYNKPGLAGVSVLVVKDGKEIYRKHGGYADIAKNQLISDKTLFNMASDTKQFTAGCIMMLELKGKLKLTDKLSKYFPDFPEYANKISIQDLLNHTSGLMDYRTLTGISGNEQDDVSNAYIRQLLIRNNLNSEPGTEFSYTNSGYWFLVQIVEQVSKLPIEKFADINIFKPLKMNDTRYVRDISGVKNAAMGYKFIDHKYVVCDTDNGPFGGGGIVSNTNDMLKWLTEMDSQKVLGAAFWNAMLNGTKYQFDKNGLYSNGLEFLSYYGKKRICHGGYLDGYHSVMSYFPDEKLNIIVLTNRGDFDVAAMHRLLASQFLGFKFSWPLPEVKAPKLQLSHKVLEQYAGMYEAQGMLFEISVSDNAIHVLQVADNVGYDIPPAGEALFSFAEVGADLLFVDVVNGKAQVLQLTQDGETLAFKRTTNYVLPDYSNYIGQYRCKTLDVEYVFFEKQGKLYYTIGKREALPVGAIAEDTMKIIFDLVTFHRNTDGNVNGFTLNHPRAKNLEFVKI